MALISELMMIIGNILILWGIYLISVPATLVIGGISLILWGYILLKVDYLMKQLKGGDET